MKLTRRLQADDRAARAEDEQKDLVLRVQKSEDDRKLMADQLVKALEDWVLAKEEMRAEQEWAGDLAKELSSLQRQRQSTEKIWAEEVG